MLLDSRNNLFIFEFPKQFFPKEIQDKWEKYLNRFNTPIKTVKDFVNITIQGINTSSLSYDVAEQNKTQKRSSRKWRSTSSKNSLSSKDLTVTFKMVDGYANYFLMMEIFLYWYEFTNEENYCPPFSIYTVDSDGNYLLKFDLIDVLFNNLEGLNLSHNDDIQDFSTFDAQFEFNRFEISFPFD